MNIIQTWKTRTVPASHEPFVKKVRYLHPTWNYMFFDDNDIKHFIERSMPEYYDTFYNLKGKIQQIDFFRYLAIYFFGGVYLDLDIELIRPFHDFENMDHNCVFPIEIKAAEDHLLKTQNVPLIGNYAFYAPKGHPFIKKIIDNIVTQRISEEIIHNAQVNHSDDARDVYVYYRTGPLLVSQSFVDFKKENHGPNDVILTEPNPYIDNCFGPYGFHRFFGTWRHIQSDQTPM